MSFPVRFVAPWKPPTRAYVHETVATKDVFSGNPNKAAARHLQDVYQKHVKQLEQFDYVISLIWATELDKMIDMAGVSGINANWNGNCELSAFNFRNGTFQQQTEITIGMTTCEHGAQIIGQETAHRKTCKDIEEFMGSNPIIKIAGSEIIMHDIPFKI